jgi:uncharacterized membrane-anchored protein
MKRWFYVIVALQLLFLIGESASNQIGLIGGRTVVLKILPVDPRSLLMGNYMQLRYEISSIDLKKVEHDPSDDIRPGRPIYVGLAPGSPYASAVSVSATKPPDNALVWLKGTTVYKGGNVIEVEYGLERYYIPETKSEEANNLGWRRDDVAVEVSVSGSGTGRIRRILAGGKPLGF